MLQWPSNKLAIARDMFSYVDNINTKLQGKVKCDGHLIHLRCSSKIKLISRYIGEQCPILTTNKVTVKSCPRCLNHVNSKTSPKALQLHLVHLMPLIFVLALMSLIYLVRLGESSSTKKNLHMMNGQLPVRVARFLTSAESAVRQDYNRPANRQRWFWINGPGSRDPNREADLLSSTSSPTAMSSTSPLRVPSRSTFHFQSGTKELKKQSSSNQIETATDSSPTQTTKTTSTNTQSLRFQDSPLSTIPWASASKLIPIDWWSRLSNSILGDINDRMGSSLSANNRNRLSENRFLPNWLQRFFNNLNERIGARNSIRVHNAFRDLAWRLLSSFSMPTPIIYELRRQHLYSPEEDLLNDIMYNRNTSKTLRIGRELKNMFTNFTSNNWQLIKLMTANQNQNNNNNSYYHHNYGHHHHSNQTKINRPKDRTTFGQRRSMTRPWYDDMQLQSLLQPYAYEQNQGPGERLRNRLEELIKISRPRPLFGRVIRLPSLLPFRRRTTLVGINDDNLDDKSLARKKDHNNSNNNNSSPGRLNQQLRPVLDTSAIVPMNQPFEIHIVKDLVPNRNQNHSNNSKSSSTTSSTRKPDGFQSRLKQRFTSFRRTTSSSTSTPEPEPNFKMIVINGKRFALDDDSELIPIKQI